MTRKKTLLLSFVALLCMAPGGTAEFFEPCDIDRDRDCDARDFEVFSTLIGACRNVDDLPWTPRSIVVSFADTDHDGCVTAQEMRQFVGNIWSLDGDKDIDNDDLRMLMQDQGRPFSESRCGNRCDVTGDAQITYEDAQKLEQFCTRPKCAVE